MSIKHLRTLIAVADHRTFSEAAEAVFLTHAAVSQQMRTLEVDLGLTLFDRTTRTPTLNATGRAMVEKAREVLRAYENMVPSILDETTLSGQVSLGALPTTLTGLLPRAMAGLKVECPELRLHIRPGLTLPLITAIERNQLDAALITLPAVKPRGLEFLEIAKEPLRLIASPRAAAIAGSAESLLRREPFIRFNRDAVAGAQIEGWLQAQNIPVSEAMELDNLDAIASMVAADLGVSIVPQPCVPTTGAPQVMWLDLAPPPPPRVLGLAYKSDTPKGRIMTAIHAALIAACEMGAA